MISIGLDLASTSGVAIVEDGKLLNVTTVTSKNKNYIERAREISHDILQLMPSLLGKNLKTVDIFIEGYGFGRTANIEPLFCVGTIMRYKLHVKGRGDYKVVPPTSLKQFVTGKGNANKDLMMMSVLKNWDIETKNNNEADAVGLAMFGLAYHNKIKMPVLNMKAVDKLRAKNEGKTK